MTREGVLSVLWLDFWLSILVTTLLSTFVVNSEDVGVLPVAFTTVIFRINRLWGLEGTQWLGLTILNAVNLFIGRWFLLQLMMRKVGGYLFGARRSHIVLRLVSLKRNQMLIQWFFLTLFGNDSIARVVCFSLNGRTARRNL